MPRPENSPADPRDAHDPYSSLRLPSVRRYLSGNFLFIIGLQMQIVAAGSQVFDMTKSEGALGLKSLLQALPVLLLALVAGHVADRYNRKWVVAVTLLFCAMASLGLAINAWLGGPVMAIYACLLAHATSRTFQQPARQSILPLLAPDDLTLANSMTWGTSGFQAGSIIGPLLGGALLRGFGSAAPVYLCAALGSLSFFVVLLGVHPRAVVRSKHSPTAADLFAGIRYLKKNRIVLGAMTLDLMAVLFGGATVLLPVFQEKILHVDKFGLGVLQAAPAVGALVMGVAMAHRPPIARAGRALLWSVFGYGIATILFGFSTSFWFCAAMLAVTGAFDNVSVIIRHTLVQLLTPDEMRGRVSAVNGVFIGASNELGNAEAGFVASYAKSLSGSDLFGTQFSVISGGFGTLLVAAVTAVMFPKLRDYGRIGDARIEDSDERV